MKLTADFKRRLLAREWLTGTFLTLGSPTTAEIAAHAGYDWVLIDHEHGIGGEDTMFGQLRAVGGAPAFPIVRIPANEAWRFKRVLDAGAHGVMVPLVNSADEARAAVTAMRYPPHGIRGVAGFHRGAGYGTDWEDYFKNANEQLVLVAQIETPAGLEQVEAIAAVDGVDVVFLGPTDMTYNMGIPAQFENPDYVAVQKRVVAAAKAAGKAAGILVHNEKHVGIARDLGFTFTSLGSDVGAVRNGLLSALDALSKNAPGR